jgi:hypothetical protein
VLLPENEGVVVTQVTGKHLDDIVTTVTNALPSIAATIDDHNMLNNKALFEVLPMLPQLPTKMSIIENMPIRKCNWCKSTDFWLGGTYKNPHRICRKCHPPAPGAEVIHAK